MQASETYCKWGYDDCTNLGDEDICFHCVTDGDRYKERKVKRGLRKRAQKADKRMGSSFEFANHQKNNEAISRMTVNSGATNREKGDELIDGLVPVMEELKTQMDYRAKGTKSFTIRRAWLDKLHREASARGREFWDLVFSFSENEGASEAGEVFVVLEKQVFMDMYLTMCHDRKVANQADSKVDYFRKSYVRIEAEKIALEARIDELEAKLKLTNKENNTFTDICNEVCSSSIQKRR